MSEDNKPAGLSRRRLLAGAGTAGAGLAAASAGILPGIRPAAARAAVTGAGAAGHSLPPGAPANSMLFGRIFPQLPPFAPVTDAVQAALLEVGAQGGILDAQDDLAAGPKALIVDPTVNGNPTAANPYGTNPDNPTMTAGSTFVGQFTDHDITFDQTSHLGVTTNPLTSPNTRTPALDLDSVFGGGPTISPGLYVPGPGGSAGPQLLIGSGGVHEDVPRTANGDGTYSAILGDPRNDENVMIAGLHCAHILFYNRVLSELGSMNLSRFPAARGADSRELSSARSGDRALNYLKYLIARQVTLWHYQWLLVNEHLPQIAGQQVVNDVLANGNQFYRPPPGDAFMPIEFGAACLPVRPLHGPAVLPGQLHQRHRRLGQPGRRPVLRPGLRRDRGRLQRPGQLRPRRPARRLPRAAPLRRLADLLRPRRRPGQEQQEDRHHDLLGPVHPAAAGHRPAHPDRAHRAAAAQPAAPAHLEPALGPGRRGSHGCAHADRR